MPRRLFHPGIPTAREHPTVLFIGLAFSVTLMGIAANFVARLVQKYKWIAWIGLLIILFVSLKMIYEGWHEISVQMAL